MQSLAELYRYKGDCGQERYMDLLRQHKRVDDAVKHSYSNNLSGKCSCWMDETKSFTLITTEARKSGTIFLQIEP